MCVRYLWWVRARAMWHGGVQGLKDSVAVCLPLVLLDSLNQIVIISNI